MWDSYEACVCQHAHHRHDMGHGCIDCRCCGFQEPEARTRYESHAWTPSEDDDECVACGVTWQDCEGECPGVVA